MVPAVHFEPDVKREPRFLQGVDRLPGVHHQAQGDPLGESGGIGHPVEYHGKGPGDVAEAMVREHPGFVQRGDREAGNPECLLALGDLHALVRLGVRAQLHPELARPR